MFSAGGSNWHVRDPTQMVRGAVVETVINFAFLYTGCLAYVDNAKGVDMLKNFKYACLTFAKKSGLALVASRSLLERPRAVGASEGWSASRRALHRPVPPIEANRSDGVSTSGMEAEHVVTSMEINASSLSTQRKVPHREFSFITDRGFQTLPIAHRL